MKLHLVFLIISSLAGIAIVYGDGSLADTEPQTATVINSGAHNNDTAAQQAEASHPQVIHREHTQKKMIVVKETRDTVFVLDQSSIHDLIKNWQQNIGTLRKRGIGLSGVSTYGAYAISLAPVEELVDKTPFLSSKHFDFSRFSYEPFFTKGGAGYIGLGDGFRLGGGGMTGQRTFSSNRFSGDSILVLAVQVNCGGFMVEKAVVSDRWNFTAGGTIGGGSIKVTASEKNSSSWFTNADDDMESFDDLFEKGNSAEAGFFMVEPHCGASYTFFPFFHVGLNVTLPAFLSVEKFNIYTNDFFTVNPGFSLKLIFGNLG